MLARAPLDLRANAMKMTAPVAPRWRSCLGAGDVIAGTRPWPAIGRANLRLFKREAYNDGLFEVQDAASQIAAAKRSARQRWVDDHRPVRGGGGQGRWRSQRSAPQCTDHRVRHQPRAPCNNFRRGAAAGRCDAYRNPPSQSGARKRVMLADLLGAGRRRDRRCALFGQRHVAAQSRTALAADPAATRAASRRASGPAGAGSSAGATRWRRWFMPLARFWRARGVIRSSGLCRWRGKWHVEGRTFGRHSTGGIGRRAGYGTCCSHRIMMPPTDSISLGCKARVRLIAANDKLGEMRCG